MRRVKKLRHSHLAGVVDDAQSKNKLLNFKSGTFWNSLVNLLADNFATIEAQTRYILFALREMIVIFSDNIDVQKDSLPYVEVSLGSPGNIGMPSVWKVL